jgi:hypothetical protein
LAIGSTADGGAGAMLVFHRPMGFSMKRSSAWFVAAGLALASCSYRPARFFDRPPVIHARDMSPIPMPAFRWVPESVYLSEVYLHRPIRGTLDLAPISPAGDVNSLDEVPTSSWFTPRDVDVGVMARGPEGPGPPRPPFTVLSDDARAVSSSGFSVSDALGQRYEMLIDPPDRPEMRTGAAAIAARLTWALGLNTFPVYVTMVRPEHFWRSEAGTPDVPAMLTRGAPAVSGSYRVAALAMPSSVWIGYALESGTRGDDANDAVPHEDRRTLRSLNVFASWMALSGLGPPKTMDRYLGAPGEGHVVHFFTGLDDALGADDIVRVTDLPPGQGGGSPLVRLITLGLAPNPPPRPTQVEIPALGQLGPDVDPSGFKPSIPYEPADRLTPADGYWAAKRIAALSSAHIALAIEGGKITDPRARRAIQSALEARRERVIRHWFERVTPVELTKLEGTRLELRDQAIRHGWARAATTDYYVDFLTSEGAGVGEKLDIRPQADVWTLDLPESVLSAGHDYVVVRIIVRRDHRRAPRAFAVHLRIAGGKIKMIGLRH